MGFGGAETLKGIAALADKRPARLQASRPLDSTESSRGACIFVPDGACAFLQTQHVPAHEVMRLCLTLQVWQRWDDGRNDDHTAPAP